MTNKDKILTFWSELNNRNYSILDEMCSSNVSSHSYGISRAKTSNLIEYRNEFQILFKAFPDYKLDIFKIVEQDNEVWIYGMQLATQQAQFHGISATFNKFEIALFSIYEFQEGKIIRETILTDTLALYRELGAAVISSQNKETMTLYMQHLTDIGLLPPNN